MQVGFDDYKKKISFVEQVKNAYQRIKISNMTALLTELIGLIFGFILV